MTGSSGLEAALSLMSPGKRVYIAGCAGEPTSFLDAVAADPARASGVTFTGVFIPGANRRDPSREVADARVETFFVTPELAAGFKAGRVSFLPLHYTAIARRLSAPHAADIAVIRVSRPAPDNTVSLGVAADFSAGLAATGARLVAEISHDMPDVPDGPRLPLEKFAAFYDSQAPLIDFQGGATPSAVATIGRRIAAMIEPGDTIQLGLGKVQDAVLAALSDHQDLGMHSGMTVDAILPLLDRNVFSRGVTVGVALGSTALYERCGRDPVFSFRPAGFTHAARTLAAIERLVAINAVLEVDLFGQAVSDIRLGHQMSGTGGLVDFVRGAALSPGGRSIIALPATAGAASRIVPRLAAGAPITLPRSDAQFVVTEHGVANLRELDIDGRADALIAIAAPEHRDCLANEWSRVRSSLA